ncbi:hypothetical protein F2Q69_00020277 [Brassica cretica]|uniref:Uncharacterized protein n=1 Tax=Brassica cretica TaxID=69181 RepID=A0A8S9PWT1_BRACR|nr:hypothetical protein F2Q69_00020277 [Brassica cretica]
MANGGDLRLTDAGASIERASPVVTPPRREITTANIPHARFTTPNMLDKYLNDGGRDAGEFEPVRLLRLRSIRVSDCERNGGIDSLKSSVLRRRTSPRLAGISPEMKFWLIAKKQRSFIQVKRLWDRRG